MKNIKVSENINNFDALILSSRSGGELQSSAFTTVEYFKKHTIVPTGANGKYVMYKYIDDTTISILPAASGVSSYYIFGVSF